MADNRDIEDRDIEVSGEEHSTSSFETALKNKWLMAIGGVVLFIVVGSMLMNEGPKERVQREAKEQAVTLIPGDIRENDWISTAQAEIRAARDQMSKVSEENNDLLNAIRAKDRENETMMREMQRMAREFEQINSQNQRLIERIEDEPTRPARQADDPAPTPRPQLPIAQPRDQDGNPYPDGVVPPPRPADLIDSANRDRNVDLPLRPDAQPPAGRIVGPANRELRVIRGTTAAATDAASGDVRQVNEIVTRNKFAGYLPGGSFADVVLMSGAEVGTADFTRSNPQPFLMRVQTEAITAGDGRYSVESCFVIGSGFGELSSERAFVRVNRLICLDPVNKLVLEEEIEGYVVDSDGTQGLHGEVIRRNGQLIAKALLAGVAEGITTVAQAASQASARSITSPISGNQQTSNVNIDAGDLGQAGLFGGAANAASQLADLYITEAKSIFPVIRIEAGRKATLVLLSGTSLEWKEYGGLYQVRQEPVQQGNQSNQRER